jgi:hypothetical protein
VAGESVLRDLPPAAVLAALGGVEAAGSGPRRRHRRWHVAEHRGVAVRMDDWVWCCESCSVAGRGAIDLVRHVRHVGIGEACAWLRRLPEACAAAGGSHPHTHLPSRRGCGGGAPASPPPPPAPAAWEDARAYLVRRGVAAAVVDAAHEAGAVYAVAPHGWTNVAFPLVGGGLAVRGIGASTYRGMYAPAGCWCWRRAPGRVVVAAESAIDALAYVSLHGDVSAAVATCGEAAVRRTPEAVRELLPDGGVVVLAQDGDAAGERQAATLAEALHALGFETRRDRPEAKDWADVAAARDRA